MWFIDIAYDEIPERHYKESEVSGDKLLTSGRTDWESELMRLHMQQR